MKDEFLKNHIQVIPIGYSTKAKTKHVQKTVFNNIKNHVANMPLEPQEARLQYQIKRQRMFNQLFWVLENLTHIK